MSVHCSAADLYIKDYIDPYISAGDHPEAVPLRIVYRHRWTQAVHPTVLKYCLLNTDSSVSGGFRVPRLDEVAKFRLVVATLGTSMQLFDIGINIGACVWNRDVHEIQRAMTKTLMPETETFAYLSKTRP